MVVSSSLLDSSLCVHSLQYTVHTKRVPFDSDNEVSPYSLSPLSNKRYGISHLPQTEQLLSQILSW